VATTEEAMRVAAMAVRAGADWLEVGTPLVLAEGMRALGELAPAFPGRTFFVDAKIVDSARRSVLGAAALGAELIAICGIATDATIREDVAGGREAGIGIVVDLVGAADPVRRARESAALGADLVYLHYGADEMLEDPAGDPTIALLPAVKAAAGVPVGAVTFDAANAVAAVAAGADIVLIGHPYLVGPDAEAMLTDFVEQVHAATPI
jgi:3-hexulose-6-phosphate synthase/6-phospho-3-hexuloisomerase